MPETCLEVPSPIAGHNDPMLPPLHIPFVFSLCHRAYVDSPALWFVFVLLRDNVALQSTS